MAELSAWGQDSLLNIQYKLSYPSRGFVSSWPSAWYKQGCGGHGSVYMDQYKTIVVDLKNGKETITYHNKLPFLQSEPEDSIISSDPIQGYIFEPQSGWCVQSCPSLLVMAQANKYNMFLNTDFGLKYYKTYRNSIESYKLIYIPNNQLQYTTHH